MSPCPSPSLFLRTSDRYEPQGVTLTVTVSGWARRLRVVLLRCRTSGSPVAVEVTGSDVRTETEASGPTPEDTKVVDT